MFNRIVLLENGMIAEDGTHTEFSRTGSDHELLWDHQTDAFLTTE